MNFPVWPQNRSQNPLLSKSGATQEGKIQIRFLTNYYCLQLSPLCLSAAATVVQVQLTQNPNPVSDQQQLPAVASLQLPVKSQHGKHLALTHLQMLEVTTNLVAAKLLNLKKKFLVFLVILAQLQLRKVLSEPLKFQNRKHHKCGCYAEIVVGVKLFFSFTACDFRLKTLDHEV